MFSGPLVGGPIKGVLHHPEPVYVIGKERVDVNPKLIIGWCGGSTEHMQIGRYEFVEGSWHWRSPNA